MASNPAKADWDYWAYDASDRANGLKLYTVDSKSENATLRATKCWNDPTKGDCDTSVQKFIINNNSGNIIVETPYSNGYQEYDISSNTWSTTTFETWKDNYSGTTKRLSIISTNSGEKILEITGDKLLTKKSDGSVQIGSDGNDIDITAEGLNIDGNPLITIKDNGEIHIGKNSLITTQEEETLSDGRKVQPLYAKDADGNKIPINIDGSKLLIDGVEVTAADSAQVTTNKKNISTNTSNISTNTVNIKNLGEGVAGSTALTAALTALPQTSKESKLSCGVGSGAFSSRYAVGFGCASKVNERVDINAGGSYVFGGSKSYGEGTLDSGVIKAGFVFKLGKLNNSTQISMKEKENFKSQIQSLEEKNKIILSKNQKLENKLSILMARLDKIEKIALGKIKSKDIAVYQLK